jgi:hypothetical protein
MAKWDIDPAGVQAVLTRTGTHGQDLANGLTRFLSDTESAAQTSASALIASALGNFLQAREAELQGIQSHVQTALDGTAKATVAYVLGDQQMAANAQHTAAQAAQVPTLPTAAGRRVSNR